MRIARVFPRRTNATPDDELTFTSLPPRVLPEISEVNISVTFSFDINKAEQLAEAWSKTGLPVKLGGPALSDKGGPFEPGKYLRKGYVITSRGCPNKNGCWFCSVPIREGSIRELPITVGWNVLDSNLLACSEIHIRAVSNMLKQQPERPVFTGGLEARLLRAWHVDLLREVKTKRLYCAYDNPDDYEALIHAGKLLRDGGITKSSHTARCYVLIGYPGDKFEKAEKRLREAWTAGFLPFAMLYRNEKGEVMPDWTHFQRMWARPHIVHHLLKEDSIA